MLGGPLVLNSDGEWPWDKKGILFLLVDFKGEPFPPKQKKSTTGQLGETSPSATCF